MSQEETRKKIEIFLNGGRHTPTEISRMLDINRTTVYRVKKRLADGTTLKHKRGGGRPGKVSAAIKQSAVHIIKNDPEISLRKIAVKISDRKCMNISKSTIHLTLRKLRYSKPFPSLTPLLSEKNRHFRIAWARKNINKFWCRAVFADEASFWLNRGRVRMWTKAGVKRFQKTTKHSPKLHIWAAFSSFGTFRLCVFRRNLDVAFY